MTRVDFFAGAVFGKLTLRQKCRESKKISATIRKQWIADCACGKRITVPQYYLIRNPNPKVDCGECPDKVTTRTKFNQEYRIWLMMRVRTTDPRHISYKHYGERGISMHPEWFDMVTGFDKFLEHIGPRPSERHSVDRYPDPDGHYEPGNVRWALPDQQAANKSRMPKGSKVSQPCWISTVQSQSSDGKPGMESGTEIRNAPQIPSDMEPQS